MRHFYLVFNLIKSDNYLKSCTPIFFILLSQYNPLCNPPINLVLSTIPSFPLSKFPKSFLKYSKILLKYSLSGKTIAYFYSSLNFYYFFSYSSTCLFLFFAAFPPTPKFLFVISIVLINDINSTSSNIPDSFVSNTSKSLFIYAWVIPKH